MRTAKIVSSHFGLAARDRGFAEKIMKTRTKKMETIEPVGLRVLVRKDDDKKETRGGIVLPDDMKIPVLTGRIVAVSAQVEADDDYPIRELDKVIVNPSNGIPVDLEHDNKLFVIPVEDILAVIRTQKSTTTGG